MKYVFGPVPSRRLGQSLGIDTIPLKTCNWNCVYCQLGRTRPLTNERREYIPSDAILRQLEEALSRHEAGEIDWLTFVGSGEPTLHRGLGKLIAAVKDLSDLPVAVITNGSLLYLPQVRAALKKADAVLPSLDAGSAQLYRRINRPHPETMFERLVNGLIAFRREYTGKLWIEVMLVQGLNDSDEALDEIAALLRRIRPDEVHLNLPTRPPAETWVRPASDEAVLRALVKFSESARVVHPAEGVFDLGCCDSAFEAILAIITRHPMSQEQLEKALGQLAPEEAAEVLAELEASDQVQVVERLGSRFWSADQSYYPDESRDPRRVK
ncbi:MAG: radical SAM protein [Candidatus Promineifilaceae bacterium]|jgi:wyosine [tRNA(Phe)-imidazoG37] synthetase (radical SAM superfamily)